MTKIIFNLTEHPPQDLINLVNFEIEKIYLKSPFDSNIDFVIDKNYAIWNVQFKLISQSLIINDINNGRLLPRVIQKSLNNAWEKVNQWSISRSLLNYAI